MKKISLAAVVLILLMSFGPVMAQEEEEDEYSKLLFQGRVGGMYTGGDPYQMGAAFEVGALVHFKGPIYLQAFGGISNFDSEGDVVPLTEEFGQLWDGITEVNDILNIDDLRYKLNFVGAGLAIKMNTGRFSPMINAGIGAYHTKFVTSFTYVNKTVPAELQEQFSLLSSLEDSKWEYGLNLGGGLYYRFNPIINFGAHVNYHMIDSEAIEDQVSFTFGMLVEVP